MDCLCLPYLQVTTGAVPDRTSVDFVLVRWHFRTISLLSTGQDQRNIFRPLIPLLQLVGHEP